MSIKRIKYGYLLISSLVVHLNSLSQNETKFGLTGSYQQFNQAAVSFGILLQSEATWPKLNFESIYENKLRGQYFLNSTGKNIIGAKYSFFRTAKFIGVGFDSRHLFQGKSHRLDFGPALKVGYTYFWLEYSVNFSLGDNLFTKNTCLNPVSTNRISHNLGICITIPLIDLKNK